jgi:hypothetical protein
MAEDSETRDPTGDVVIASGDWDAIFCIVPLTPWPVGSCSRLEFEAHSLVFISASIYCMLKICNQD